MLLCIIIELGIYTPDLNHPISLVVLDWNVVIKNTRTLNWLFIARISEDNEHPLRIYRIFENGGRAGGILMFW